MKKVISGVIAAAMVAVLAFSLAACNNKTPVDSNEPGTSAPAGVTVEASTAA